MQQRFEQRFSSDLVQPLFGLFLRLKYPRTCAERKYLDNYPLLLQPYAVPAGSDDDDQHHQMGLTWTPDDPGISLDLPLMKCCQCGGGAAFARPHAATLIFLS